MKNLTTLSIQEIFNRALFFYQTNQLKSAKELYQKLLKALPNDPDVLANLGSIELQLGNFEIGTLYLEKSLKINKNQPYALNNLANGLYEMHKFSDALKVIENIQDLNFVDAHYNKGRIFKAMDRFDDAIESYNKTIDLNCNYIAAFINRGLIYNQLKQYDKALNSFEDAIKINPSYAEAYYNCGKTYYEMKEYNKALTTFEEAIKINPAYAEACYNLGVINFELRFFDKALHFYQEAIKINPKYAEAYYNIGLMHYQLKQFDKAIKSYKKAININPNYSEAIVGLSIIKLDLKDFKEGWINYEKRFLLDEYKRKDLNYKNEKLNLNIIKISRKLLVVSEQGIGDQILFASLLSDLLLHVQHVELLADERLIPLLKRSFPQIFFISNKVDINYSEYDAIIPMGSLGKFFRNSNKDFEKAQLSYLKSDVDKSNFLKLKSKKLCGLSWKSRNEKIGENKSINLEVLFPILKLPNLDFVCLQYGEVDEDIEKLAAKYNIEIKKVEDVDIYNNIDGLASIIQSMDFVVTTSNLTVHLAGALGVKTYLLAPYSLGKIWYWHEGDIQSIWYPSVKIYRQINMSDWEAPVNKIANDLKGGLDD